MLCEGVLIALPLLVFLFSCFLFSFFQDATAHNNTMEKWKRRETNLEAVRHEALVESQLSKSRLEDQKAATQSAISMSKITKETLSSEIARLRKQLATKNQAEIHKVDQERLRLEREVSRLKNEIQRVRSHTKTHVAAAAAAAATAAFDGATIGGGKGNLKNTKPNTKNNAGGEGGRPSFIQSSKERIAQAESKTKQALEENTSLTTTVKALELQLKTAKKESATATSYVKKKVQALQNEIEMLHSKLQERKKELMECKEFNHQQEIKWRKVQNDINEDTKKRRELGILVATTEQKNRETQYVLKKAEENFKHEQLNHEKTVDSLKNTTEAFTVLKTEFEALKLKQNELVSSKNISEKEQLSVLKEMKSMEGECNKFKKEVLMWEQTSQEQKELLQDATRSIRGYV